jgi:hypothetical protein
MQEPEELERGCEMPSTRNSVLPGAGSEQDTVNHQPWIGELLIGPFFLLNYWLQIGGGGFNVYHFVLLSSPPGSSG